MSLKDKVAKLAKFGKEEALKVLERINTPEVASKLKGAEREEYLKALDEVHGPREQRAKDLGFDLADKKFHGSNKANIEEFRTGREGLFGSGIYTTNSPEIASSYAKPKKGNRFQHDSWSHKTREQQLEEYNRANSPTVYPVVTKKSSSAIDMDAPLDLKIWEKADSPYISKKEIESLPKDATNADAYKLFQENMADAEVHTSEAPVYSEELLQSLGVDTITHKGGLRAGNGEILHDVTIKTKPEDIRSVNAAFDPRFKNSGNIAAGLGGAAVLGSLAGSNEAEASPVSLKDTVAKLAGKFFKDEKTAKLVSTMKDYETNSKILPAGYATEEAGMVFDQLPAKVKKQLAQSGASPEEIVEALYSKYFNYGVQKNKFTELLPDKLPAAAAAVGAGGALMSGSEAEASPVNSKKAIKAVEEIASKFREPRGVLKKTPHGAEIVIPDLGGKPLTISGNTPEEAAKIYQGTFGDQPIDINPHPEQVRERLINERKRSNLENPEDATDPGFVEKAFDKLSVPQKILLERASKLMGAELPEAVKGQSAASRADQDSEAITEKAASAIGVENPYAKAALKTAIDLGADPLNAIGSGWLKKGASKLPMAERLIKKAPGVLGEGKKIAAESVENAVRKLNESTFFQNMRKEKAKSIAEQLLEKGAKEIKGAKIFSGKK